MNAAIIFGVAIGFVGVVAGILGLGMLAERGAAAHGSEAYRDIQTECGDCGETGTPSTHKGDPTIECQDCERVLYREVGE